MLKKIGSFKFRFKLIQGLSSMIIRNIQDRYQTTSVVLKHECGSEFFGGFVKMQIDVPCPQFDSVVADV